MNKKAFISNLMIMGFKQRTSTKYDLDFPRYSIEVTVFRQTPLINVVKYVPGFYEEYDGYTSLPYMAGLRIIDKLIKDE